MIRLAQIIPLLAIATGSVLQAAVISDPAGDTFGVGSVQLDITSADAIVSGTSLTFILTFQNAIRPASALVTNSLYGFIDIDADRNASTGGGGSNQGSLGPAPAPQLNDEFFLDIG